MSEKHDAVFETREIKNPDLVKKVKKCAAELLELYEEIAFVPSDDVSRLAALARTDLEMSVMWAIKAISRQN